MNMNALKEIISDLVDKEKTSAIKNHGYAHSDHEALALLQEEIWEAGTEMQRVRIYEHSLKKQVYTNNDDLALEHICEIKNNAIKATCELIQVAAMCDKFIESREVREYDESE